ncbi:MAG: hypothetical protein J1F23_06470 [Oscillospiraceae bacterium]|nr:hypothetical protein [Oscillospiraceae bacterium]
METVKKLLIAASVAFACWFMLSYLFFPIKLAAAPDVYFTKTMLHMIPLKTVITVIFALFSVFIYEQRRAKK